MHQLLYHKTGQSQGTASHRFTLQNPRFQCLATHTITIQCDGINAMPPGHLRTGVFQLHPERLTWNLKMDLWNPLEDDVPLQLQPRGFQVPC